MQEQSFTLDEPELAAEEQAAELEKEMRLPAEGDATPDIAAIPEPVQPPPESEEEPQKPVSSQASPEIQPQQESVAEPALQPEVNHPEVSQPMALLEAEVVISFNSDCWIRVEDSTGKVVAEGIKTPERVVIFSGQPPFNAIIGLPSAVEITYQGKPFDFEVADPKRPLRLIIPESE